jgi:ABC-2 type transport system ATP-binding protein
MTPAIDASDLVKTFGSTRALDGLDLTVETGHVHGFLGPNGAGKTTAMRVLLGLLRHDSGTVSMLGQDPWYDAVDLHRRLAYVPGDVHLWPNLSGGEVIDLLGDLRGGLDPTRREDLIERFQLDPTKRCRTYSKGNRQKVAIVAAFSSDVELLLLDEPTSGLDPVMATIFEQVVKEAAEEGKTALLSSHILSEAEALCDNISIIREGRIVESGTLQDLRHLTRTSVTAQTRQPVEGLETVDGVHGLEIDGTHVHFHVDSDQIEPVLQRVMAAGVTALTSTPPTLAELFLRHYGDQLTDNDIADDIDYSSR